MLLYIHFILNRLCCNVFVSLSPDIPLEDTQNYHYESFQNITSEDKELRMHHFSYMMII